MKKYCLIFCVLFAAFNLYGQYFVVSNLPNQDKLPMGHINRIYQDSEGYMWYGTERGGLYRDDGYYITTFRSDFNTPNLLESNWITCIAEDKSGRIWFGTKRGAYIIDKKGYQIIPLDETTIARRTISSIDVLSDSTIWVSSDDLIVQFNSDKKALNYYTVDINDQRRPILQLYQDESGNIWMVRWRAGLFLLDKEKNDFIYQDWYVEGAFPTSIVQSPGKSYYWLSTWGKGIVKYNPHAINQNNLYAEQTETFSWNNSFQGQLSKCVLDTLNNFLWTVSGDNLYAYQIHEDESLSMINTADFLDQGKKLLSDLTIDKSGNIWVAGYNPHSFVISSQEKNFIRDEMTIMNTSLGIPPSPNVMATDGTCFWMYQKNIGLFVYFPTINEVRTFSYTKRKMSPILEKRKNNNGVYAVLNNQVILLFTHKNFSIEDTYIATLPVPIRALHEDVFGNLWVGSVNDLYRVDVHTKRVSHEWEHTGIINDIASLPDGSIYITTESDGLLHLSPQDEKFIYETDEHLQSITADANQKLWISTEQGSIYLFDHHTKTFSYQTKECGLTGEPILGIETDQFGYIWILTDQKVIAYNHKNRSFNITHCTDPLVGMTNYLSINKSTDNQIVVTGTDGLCVFPSKDFEHHASNSQTIHLTAFKVNGESKLAGNHLNVIRLKPKESNLELFLSLLDPLHAGKTHFAFKHKGNSEYWNYLPEGQNNIYLTALNAGKHELEIRAADHNGLWSSNTTKIIIYKQAFWYQTWMAYVIYSLIIAALFYYLIKTYIKEKERKHQMAMEEQISEMKYRFFTNISHEFRTPLTLIITPLESILRQLESTNLRKQLETVKRNAYTLLNLVNQLLDFRKIEIGGESLTLSKGEIREFIHQIYENFYASATDKKLNYKFHSEFTSYYLFADFDKVQKIINNILANAFKFTPKEGRIDVALRLETIQNRAYVSISIADTGKGIEAKNLPYIFERFRQVNDNEHHIIGSGIGLHLVKEYINLHEGKISVESELGKGSKFIIYLPTDLSAEEIEFENETETMSPVPTFTLPNKKTHQILIVEDNDEFRQYLQTELSNFYTVYVASDGEEGEWLALSKEPDLIVSDVMMPKVDGLELCSRIKKNIKTSHIPIVLLTASTNTENQKRGYKEGADAYILKPFHWEILLSCIQNLIVQRDQRQLNFKKKIDISPSEITISSIDEQLIKKAIQLVEDNIDNPDYTVEEMSSDMAMSRMTLYRKINSITGITPREFIKNIRLKRAAQLIRDGQLNSAEAAESVGFKSASYFAKSFKEMFGIYPKDYS